MIVVISPEYTCGKQVYWVNKLLENNLDYFHFRKYHTPIDKAREFLKQIDKEFMSRVVLHAHFELALEFDIKHLHYNSYLRKKETPLQERPFFYSTSCHDITEFNALDKTWNYAFLSPFYPSISKVGYNKQDLVLSSLQHKDNPEVSLIALGGITPCNYQKVLEFGADGIGLLGGVWQSDNPLKTFLQCKIKDPMF